MDLYRRTYTSYFPFSCKTDLRASVWTMYEAQMSHIEKYNAVLLRGNV